MNGHELLSLLSLLSGVALGVLLTFSSIHFVRWLARIASDREWRRRLDSISRKAE